MNPDETAAAGPPATPTEERDDDDATEPPRGAEGSGLDFPIVGIGASAGGLAAFEAFFSGMPTDVELGMAFVLVQHLAPDHKSILTSLVQRYTQMRVFEVEDGMRVEPNCAYIIPPNRDMALLNGALQLLEPSAPRGQRLPIDFFFRSLAQDQRERAICIVLSGTGSDGAHGVRAVKGEGGMVMVQAPGTTEYDGMPRSAIATGLVDFVLSPPEMAPQLLAYAAHPFGKPRRFVTASTPRDENALKKIFILLRAQTGHDFSDYKPSTIHRRIERRLAVHQINSTEEYVRLLQQTPAEVNALFRDLLIGVTCFFRDPEAFKALEEQAIPTLFASKPTGSLIRAWSPGCSTGEEAYSLAILLQERLEAIKQEYRLQVFATDLDGQSIATARAGIYPASIGADVSPERLARFFSTEAKGVAYRVRKSIRDTLVFSEQDVIKDPPFSKLDLISCRNLLIYMGAGLQKKLMPLFHYALNPGGYLFLGTSESVGDFTHLFTTVDRRSKLYRRRDDTPLTRGGSMGWRAPPATAREDTPPPPARRVIPPGRPPLRELTERALLQHVAASAALVDGRGDILYLHGRTGTYLEPVAGEAGVNNILKMAREGLMREMVTALHSAVATKTVVRVPGLRVRTNGATATVNLTIHPIPPSAAGASEAALYLVVLEEPPPSSADPSAPATPRDALGAEAPDTDDDPRIIALKHELRAKEDYLRAANEELQTSNEELKSSNEEMQSVNEELQSANEELETSREELQSVNEELATVNAELQAKVGDLSRVNNDMNNLLAGTGIGTIFVDHQLRILRFTPAATRIVNLIPGDVGRSVGHVVTNFIGYDRLLNDATEVLNTLVPREAQVQTTDGKWYTVSILPYRTLENVIEGAVITFVDITDMKRAEAALRDQQAAVK